MRNYRLLFLIALLVGAEFLVLTMSPQRPTSPRTQKPTIRATAKATAKIDPVVSKSAVGDPRFPLIITVAGRTWVINTPAEYHALMARNAWQIRILHDKCVALGLPSPITLSVYAPKVWDRAFLTETATRGALLAHALPTMNEMFETGMTDNIAFKAKYLPAFREAHPVGNPNDYLAATTITLPTSPGTKSTMSSTNETVASPIASSAWSTFVYVARSAGVIVVITSLLYLFMRNRSLEDREARRMKELQAQLIKDKDMAKTHVAFWGERDYWHNGYQKLRKQLDVVAYYTLDLVEYVRYWHDHYTRLLARYNTEMRFNATEILHLSTDNSELHNRLAASRVHSSELQEHFNDINAQLSLYRERERQEALPRLREHLNSLREDREIVRELRETVARHAAQLAVHEEILKHPIVRAALQLVKDKQEKGRQAATHLQVLLEGLTGAAQEPADYHNAVIALRDEPIKVHGTRFIGRGRHVARTRTTKLGEYLAATG